MGNTVNKLDENMFDFRIVISYSESLTHEDALNDLHASSCAASRYLMEAI